MIRTLYKPVLCLMICYSSNAQFIKNQKAFVGSSVFLSTSNQNSFWIRSNQYGTVPLESQVLQIKGGYKTEYDSTRHSETHRLKKKFDYAFGAELVGNVGKANQFIIPEAYFKTRLGAFEFYAGRRREIVGLVDTTLTTGSYIWSGNALPVPKIEISIPNYTPITKSGLVSIKGNFAHGWFGNQGIVRNFYLHQKYFYARLGKPNSKFKLYNGFNHHVQWGGESDKLTNTNWNIYNPTIQGQLAPYPWYSYQYVLIPFLQKFVSINPQKVPGYDSGLAVGNHLGSFEIAFEYNFPKLKFLLYHQKPYDFARSLYNFNNIEDGVNGFSIKLREQNKLVSAFLFEFIYTKSQGRERFGKVQESNYGEIDNYFSHGQYRNGWSYNQNIIGTPFITLENVYNNTGNELLATIINNRVRVFYCGMSGRLNSATNYQLKIAFLENFGLYTKPLSSASPSKQISSFVGFNRIISNKQKINLIFAYDSYGIYSSNIGLVASYTYVIK